MRFLLAENTALKQFDLIARIASINSVCFSFLRFADKKKVKLRRKHPQFFE